MQPTHCSGCHGDGIRVKLDLSDFVSDYTKYRWIYLAYETFSTISDVIDHLRNEYPASCESDDIISLFLEEPFCLPSWENVRLLRHGDIVKVKLSKTRRKRKRKWTATEMEANESGEDRSLGDSKNKDKHSLEEELPAAASSVPKSRGKTRKKHPRTSTLSSPAPPETSSSESDRSYIQEVQKNQPADVSTSQMKEACNGDNIGKEAGNNDFLPPPSQVVQDADPEQPVAKKSRKRKRKQKPRNRNKLSEADRAVFSDSEADQSTRDEEEGVAEKVGPEGQSGQDTNVTINEPIGFPDISQQRQQPKVIPIPLIDRNGEQQQQQQQQRPRLEKSSANVSCEDVLLGNAPCSSPLPHNGSHRPAPSTSSTVTLSPARALNGQGASQGGIPQSAPMGFEKLLGLSSSKRPVLGSRLSTTAPQSTSIADRIQSLPVLSKPPLPGNVMAFKVLEIKEDYTPGCSDYQAGKVVNVRGHIIEIQLESACKSKTKGGKFDLEKEGEDEKEDEEEDQHRCYNWTDLIEPKLIGQ